MSNKKLVKVIAWICVTIIVIIYPILLCIALVDLVYKSMFKTRKNIAGEVALVTGAAHGLGKEIAIKLAAKGCHIAVVDINEEAAKSTAKHLIDTYNVEAEAFKADVTQFDEVNALAKNVEKQLGPVTILVNNAGIMIFSRFNKPPPSEIQNMINTNIMAHFWTVRVFLDKMRELGKGHIVAISSIAGVFPLHRHLEYTTTKFAVRGLMESLQTELYALNCEFIRTTTVFPFFLQTNAKVLDIVHKTGINYFHPFISGAETAEATVEGLITNEMEVFVPGFFAVLHRLFAFAPKSFQAFLINKIVDRELISKLDY